MNENKTLVPGASGQAGKHMMPDISSRAILDALPLAVYTTDAEGRISYFNDAAAQLWGRRPMLGKDEWCGSWKLYHADGSPMRHDECPMSIALRERRAVTGMRAIAERPDGTRFTFEPYPAPLFDDDGVLIGAINVLVDVTERALADRMSQQLVAIVESSGDAIISKDLNGVIQTWNAGAEHLFGYTAEEAIGQPVTMLIPEERIDEEPGILARIRAGERIEHYETVRRRKDGTLVDVSLTVSPIKNGGGRIIGASKIGRDITDKKRAQQQQRLLLNEMKHRVKNTLATAQAIASQTMKTATSDERNAYNARLQALARAHDILTLENWSRAPLKEIVNGALEPFHERHTARFLVGGIDGLWLDASKAALLAMGLHELATNAAKYGALSNDGGTVHVSWDVPELIDGKSRVRLTWREQDGPPVTTPDKKGFGSMLIERALNSELGKAQIHFHPDGVHATLEIGL